MPSCLEASWEQPLLGSAPTSRLLWVLDRPRPWPARVLAADFLASPPSAGTLLLRQPDASPVSSEPRSFSPELPSERLLVCTHGSRDRCCGQWGVRLARTLREAGAPVWEVSHLGGHRFAPTLWCLRDWKVYGRVGLDEAGHFSEQAALSWLEQWRIQPGGCLSGLRGSARYAPNLQVLEAYLREARGQWPEQLSELSGDQVDVHWPDGRSEVLQVNWNRRSYRSSQSCTDIPLGVEADYQAWSVSAVALAT